MIKGEFLACAVEKTRADCVSFVETMHAWAIFAKDLVKGLSGFGWPIYDAKSK